MVDNVDYSDNFADIIVTPNKSTATVSGDGVRSISKVGLNTYNVVVTAQDGVSKTTYKINITKNAADTNKLLDDLAVIDKDLNNQITFDSLTTTYDITLNRDHSEVTINFTKGHPKQKVTGNIGLVQLMASLNTKYVMLKQKMEQHKRIQSINQLLDDSDTLEVLSVLTNLNNYLLGDN